MFSNLNSLNYLAPLSQVVVGATKPLQSVLNAFRNGGGVPYTEYGRDMLEGQAGINRAMFLQELDNDWLPAIPDLHDRLLADPPARVADIGCGAGWSCIGIAQSYPNIQVDGFDLDGPSIEMACAIVIDTGLSERFTFHTRDARPTQVSRGAMTCDCF